MPILTRKLVISVDGGSRYSANRIGVASAGNTQFTIARVKAAIGLAIDSFREEFGEDPNWDMVRINTIFTTTEIITELYEGKNE